MNPIATVVVSVLLASAAATAVTLTLRPAETPTDATAAADLRRTVAELRTQLDDVRGRVDARAKAPEPAAAPLSARTESATVSADQVAAAVEAYLHKRGDGAALAGKGDEAEAAAKFDLDTELGKLSGVYFDEDPELWKRLHASGKSKEAIARLEAAVKANPKDVNAQMNLANACLSCMRLEPANYGLAVRADKAFDDVLAVDDKHWEARFTKAVSYSFWPPMTGKPKQAIEHLNMLVAQQETMPPQAQEAQTYLILGNLLESSGDSAKAREVWAKGARRHPDNQDLAKRTGR
jgi:tetratricopeptide (TPR) repeat protein